MDPRLEAAGLGATLGALELLGCQPVVLYDPDAWPVKPPASPLGGAIPNAVEFDAVVTVHHRGRSRVTCHPVERGPKITDYTQAEPREIQLEEAVISNYPASVTGFITPGPRSGFAEEAWRRLETWRLRGAPLTLVTDIDTYENVVIESAELPRDVKRSNSIHTTLNLVEIVTVSTSTTTGPKPARDSAAPSKIIRRGCEEASRRLCAAVRAQDLQERRRRGREVKGMSTCELPLRSREPHYSLEIDLEGTTYRLVLDWNDRDTASSAHTRRSPTLLGSRSTTSPRRRARAWRPRASRSYSRRAMSIS